VIIAASRRMHDFDGAPGRTKSPRRIFSVLLRNDVVNLTAHVSVVADDELGFCNSYKRRMFDERR
jgi:hypothetical protein